MADPITQLSVRSTGVTQPHSAAAERDAARSAAAGRHAFDVSLDVMRAGATAAGAALGGPAGASIASALTAGATSGSDSADLFRLFEQQVAVQREMQQFTILTNVSKTAHESKMAAVRNMKA